MRIRPATGADAPTLVPLAATTMREAFGPPHNPAQLVEEYIETAITEPILEAELADPRSTFFIIENDEQIPVGYAKLRRHRAPRRLAQSLGETDKAIEIQRIYLLQHQIGQGQGRLLMQHCLDWARSAGYTVVWLGVWERNERALAFYQKNGFERFGYHYFQFGSERQRDFWLKKQL